MMNTRMKLRQLLASVEQERLPADCGVYAIINKANGRAYIGSSVNIRRRIEWHKTLLRANKHSNKNLAADWNQHGEPAFIAGVMTLCEADKRTKIEADLIGQILGRDCYNWSTSGQKPHYTPSNRDQRIDRIRSAFEAWAADNLKCADEQAKQAAWSAWHDAAFMESSRIVEIADEMAHEQRFKSKAQFVLWGIAFDARWR